MDPSVHAVVLNYNGAHWLKRCVESLLACAYRPLEVILVDNASTDKSIAIAQGASSRIHIIQNDTNLGFSGGNNVGIDHALAEGADYIALVNNDTYFEPDWIERIVEVGEANPAIGVLGPVQLLYDGADFNNWITSALPHLQNALRENDAPGVWFPVEWVEGSCLVAKRRVFERVGGLDTIFFAFFEESDLCRRARAAGFRVAIVPSSKVHHSRGGSFERPEWSRRRRVLLMRNSMIYNSTDPRMSLGGNLLGLLHNNAVHLKTALLGDGDPVVWLQATWWLVPRLPAVYRKWRTDRALVSH